MKCPNSSNFILTNNIVKLLTPPNSYFRQREPLWVFFLYPPCDNLFTTLISSIEFFLKALHDILETRSWHRIWNGYNLQKICWIFNSNIQYGVFALVLTLVSASQFCFYKWGNVNYFWCQKAKTALQDSFKHFRYLYPLTLYASKHQSWFPSIFVLTNIQCM